MAAQTDRGELSHVRAPAQSSPGPAPVLPSWPSAHRGWVPTSSCPCPLQLSLPIRPCSFPYAKTSPGEAAAGKGIQKQQFNFFLHPDQPSSHSSWTAWATRLHNHTHACRSLNIFMILRIVPPSYGSTLLSDSNPKMEMERRIAGTGIWTCTCKNLVSLEKLPTTHWNVNPRAQRQAHTLLILQNQAAMQMCWFKER